MPIKKKLKRFLTECITHVIPPGVAATLYLATTTRTIKLLIVSVKGDPGF